MRKVRKLITIFCVIAILLSLSLTSAFGTQISSVDKAKANFSATAAQTNAFWKTTTPTPAMKKNIDYALSPEAMKVIKTKIDFSKQGVQSFDIGNGISYEYTFISEVLKKSNFTIIKQVSATTSSVSSVKSGRFYITATGQTVANYQMSASFLYDGLTCVAVGGDHSETAGPSGWSIVCNTSTAGPVTTNGGYTILSKAYCKWTLNYLGFYNNATDLFIYCDNYGHIS